MIPSRLLGDPELTEVIGQEIMINRTNSKKISNSFPPVLLTILVFIISRFIYYKYFHIKFDASTLINAWQYIDPYLLQNDLLRSVFYLHSQPPLYNLFLGIILKLFPNPTQFIQVFNVIYLLFGVALAVSLYLILIKLKVSKILSFLLTSLFIINPSVVLYESWLFYAYPIILLLCLSVLFLLRLLSNDSFRDSFIFFCILAMIVLTRSIFHLLWFVLFVLILLGVKRHRWKRTITACAIPFLVILFIYVKNFLVFGTFTTGSAFVGQNLAALVRPIVSEDEISSLIKDDIISKTFVMPIFSKVSAYKPYIKTERTGIPTLDEEVKWTGEVNTQHLAYLHIARQCGKDALYIIRKHPKSYIAKLIKYYRRYFYPSSFFWTKFKYEGNYGNVEEAIRLYNRFLYGQFYFPKSKIGFFFLLGIPVLVIYSMYLIIINLSSKHGNIVLGVTILFMFITIMLVNTACLLTWEHERFRFMLEPYYLMLLGLLFTEVRSKISRVREALVGRNEESE